MYIAPTSDRERLRHAGLIGLMSTADLSVHACTLRAHGKLMASVACAHVPIITVIIGNSFGATNHMMVIILSQGPFADILLLSIK